MVFSSNIFLFAFFPLALALYCVFPKRFTILQNIFLLIASLVFYSFGELRYLPLLIISILGNYFFAIGIDKFRKEKNLIITVALAFNLAALLYFKYANFLIENINLAFDSKIKNDKIPLPLGISFFTFHAISYLVDIYRSKCQPQKNIFNLALYIAFFPQLIAGPIVRYNFIEKYLTKRVTSAASYAYGIRRFIIGLGKKVIIANPLGEVVDAIFALNIDQMNQPIAWLGIVCYAFQIYFDFSGYCDMAIGIARIFGFKFPENFNYPYISRSIKEFWRRWHISLSTWFRDYVYIPLGGNRCSLKRQYFNLVLVFFLCGFWHGASWNFVIWGLFHGSFLVFERLKFYENFLNFLPRFVQNLYAMLIVIIGWVFFRSPDLSYSAGYLKNMFSNSQIEVGSNILRLINGHFFMMSFCLALISFSPFVKNCAASLMKKNKIFIYVFDIFLIFTLLLCILRISASTHNPFIYFQF